MVFEDRTMRLVFGVLRRKNVYNLRIPTNLTDLKKRSREREARARERERAREMAVGFSA